MKRALARMIPLAYRHAIKNALGLGGHVDAEYRGRSHREVFSQIYRQRLWGDDGRSPFHSGPGSREVDVVGPYVDALRAFLSGWREPPVVVDLGCGDFHVGAQLQDLAARYIGCDVVEELIAHHRSTHDDPRLEFRCLDITAEELPEGEVVLVRQVLQHLSNRGISAFLARIPGSCRHLVVTEHVPARRFLPNVDKPAGMDVRLAIGSGVVLTRSPFRLRVLEERELCAVPHQGGIIRTIAYRLR